MNSAIGSCLTVFVRSTALLQTLPTPLLATAVSFVDLRQHLCSCTTVSKSWLAASQHSASWAASVSFVLTYPQSPRSPAVQERLLRKYSFRASALTLKSALSYQQVDCARFRTLLQSCAGTLTSLTAEIATELPRLPLLHTLSVSHLTQTWASRDGVALRAVLNKLPSLTDLEMDMALLSSGLWSSSPFPSTLTRLRPFGGHVPARTSMLNHLLSFALWDRKIRVLSFTGHSEPACLDVITQAEPPVTVDQLTWVMHSEIGYDPDEFRATLSLFRGLKGLRELHFVKHNGRDMTISEDAETTAVFAELKRVGVKVLSGRVKVGPWRCAASVASPCCICMFVLAGKCERDSEAHVFAGGAGCCGLCVFGNADGLLSAVATRAAMLSCWCTRIATVAVCQEMTDLFTAALNQNTGHTRAVVQKQGNVRHQGVTAKHSTSSLSASLLIGFSLRVAAGTEIDRCGQVLARAVMNVHRCVG